VKILITAGGTGGHIMPALAIAHAVREKLPGVGILFVGTDRGMEERLARQAGLDFIAIRALGVKGKSVVNAMRSVTVNIQAFFTALKTIKTYRPQWVIGTGGYVTGMVVLAGYLLGCRCAIQEQNSVAGLTNKILSRIAHKIFIAFPDSKHVFPRSKTILTGNPVRKEIADMDTPSKRNHLLILGGSLGASSINNACIDALRLLHDKGLDPEVTHQTGGADYPRVKQSYDEIGLKAKVYDFIDDMASVYGNSSMAVCRCGGLTLSELSRIGLPAIMVPYPHATDDHQMKNALFVASKGGGWVIPDKDLTSERLALEIKVRLYDQSELQKASLNMASIGLGDGAEKIAQEITGV
jgi:UDP-N-acetylglucosamine--N-acetylmuramyl-(pentapeptide) pyrophosphoryl-undecaprenol N-acetylglucosamine transferase